jgi:hypothetical protein
MVWYLRAIQQPDGRWACRHGRQLFDLHDELSDALEHLAAIADTIGPAEFITHWLDGEVINTGRT